MHVCVCERLCVARRLQQDRTLEDRKRNILVLIVDYLTRNGYLDSSQRLQSEAGLASKNLEVWCPSTCVHAGYARRADSICLHAAEYRAGLLGEETQVADNIDLSAVVQQYEVYYESIFLRKPQFVRQARPSEGKKEKPRSSSTMLPNIPSVANHMSDHPSSAPAGSPAAAAVVGVPSAAVGALPLADSVAGRKKPTARTSLLHLQLLFGPCLHVPVWCSVCVVMLFSVGHGSSGRCSFH
jgi:hypothetical protein